MNSNNETDSKSIVLIGIDFRPNRAKSWEPQRPSR